MTLPLEVRGLTVRYGDRTAVRRIQLEVREGEVLGLAGPNGSGKSTLLRAIAGLEAPAEGSVSVFGEPAARLARRARARAVAWMPQDEPPGDNIPLHDYVRYGRFAHVLPLGTEGPTDEQAVASAIADADLERLAERRILELSGGERQRARFARVLAQETPLLLLDEPTAHLDVGHQLDLLERVRRIARRDHRSVVLALHDLNLAARFADRIVVLDHGQAVADGPPPDVLSPELLASVWGIVARLRRDAGSGLPYLIPDLPHGDPRSPPPHGTRPRVHVVAGGGSGVELLRRLSEEGYELSAGVLHLFDSDTETGRDLGVRIVEEVPFGPLGEEARERNRGLLDVAEAIVVAPFPVGSANLANLTDLATYAGRRPLFLLTPASSAAWDFSGGAATAARAALLAAGAQPVAGIDELCGRLRELLSPGRGAAAGSAPRPDG